tara:strand:+ start:13987 stop:14382 length:396 start_codon:yes stop_codon:yes gene_type:complete
MKIALVSSKKSIVEIIPLINKILSSQIKDLQVKEVITDNNLDLVNEVSELTDFDLVAVILFYEHDSPDVKILMEKLVDLDLAGKRIMKFLEKGDGFSEEEESQRIAGEILEKLFGKKETPVDDGYGSFTTL